MTVYGKLETAIETKLNIRNGVLLLVYEFCLLLLQTFPHVLITLQKHKKFSIPKTKL